MTSLHSFAYVMTRSVRSSDARMQSDLWLFAIKMAPDVHSPRVSALIPVKQIINEHQSKPCQVTGLQVDGNELE